MTEIIYYNTLNDSNLPPRMDVPSCRRYVYRVQGIRRRQIGIL